MITRQQSIEIYARASRAWFRQNAAAQAQRKVNDCRSRNDHDGVDAWQQVKAEIERLDREGYSGTLRDRF